MDSFTISRTHSENTTDSKMFSPSPIRKASAKLHSSIACELDFDEECSPFQTKKVQSAIVSNTTSAIFSFRKNNNSTPSDVSVEDELFALRSSSSSTKKNPFYSPETVSEGDLSCDLPLRSSNPLASSFDEQ